MMKSTVVMAQVEECPSKYHIVYVASYISTRM